MCVPEFSFSSAIELSRAFNNDITMKELASEMLQIMLVEHKEETKAIIKEIRMKKGID